MDVLPLALSARQQLVSASALLARPLSGNVIDRLFTIYYYELILFEKAWVAVEFLKVCQWKGIDYFQLFYGQIWVACNVSVQQLLFDSENTNNVLTHDGEEYVGFPLRFDFALPDWYRLHSSILRNSSTEKCWLCCTIDPVKQTLELRCLEQLKLTLVDSISTGKHRDWLMRLICDDPRFDEDQLLVNMDRFQVEIPKVIEVLTQLGAISFQFKRRTNTIESIKAVRFLATNSLFPFLIRPFHLFSIIWWISIVFKHHAGLIDRIVEIFGMVMIEQFIRENSHISYEERINQFLQYMRLHDSFELIDLRNLSQSQLQFRELIEAALFRDRTSFGKGTEKEDEENAPNEIKKEKTTTTAAKHNCGFERNNSCGECDTTHVVIACSTKIGMDVFSCLSAHEAQQNRKVTTATTTNLNTTRYLLFGGRVYLSLLDFYRIVVPRWIFARHFAGALRAFFQHPEKGQMIEATLLESSDSRLPSIQRKLRQFFDFDDEVRIRRYFPSNWNPISAGAEWLHYWYLRYKPHTIRSASYWVSALRRTGLQTLLFRPSSIRFGILSPEATRLMLPNAKTGGLVDLTDLLRPEFATPPCIQMLLRMWIRDGHLGYYLRIELLAYILDLQHIPWDIVYRFASSHTRDSKKLKNVLVKHQKWFSKENHARQNNQGRNSSESSHFWSRSCTNNSACVFKSSTQYVLEDRMTKNRTEWFPDIEDLFKTEKISSKTPIRGCQSECLSWTVRKTNSASSLDVDSLKNLSFQRNIHLHNIIVCSGDNKNAVTAAASSASS